MSPETPDPLGVRAATAWVLQHAQHVRIDRDALVALARRWATQGIQAPRWEPRYHFFDGTHRSANWLLALDAANFSFWSEDPADRWEMDYHGQRLDGYWALAASLTRAVEEGTDLWDAAALAALTQGDLYRMFRGRNLIPLITDRLNNLREAGRVLLEHYGGQFVHAIDAVDGRADRLVLLLAHDFPSFNDVAVYRGRRVPFYKRAQLLVSDLWGAFEGKSWGRFENMEVLTAFADYKLPQVLRELGVLRYTPSLAGAVDTRQVLPAGCDQEVEIRAATVQACEMLRDALAQTGPAAPQEQGPSGPQPLPPVILREQARGGASGSGPKNLEGGWGPALHAFEVDWLLWQQSQSMPMAHPYHLTRTIYY